MSSISKTTDQIVEDVRICYDEIALNDSDMTGDQDESELETIIKSKIDEAMNYVYSNISEEVLDSDNNGIEVYSSIMTAKDSGLYKGAIEFQLDETIDDVYRVLWVQSASWLYAVRDMYTDGDPDGTFIFDPYCGATYEKPAVLVRATPVGRVLEIAKPKESSEEVTIAYVAKPTTTTTTEGTSYMLGEKAYSAIVYYICGLVATTFGETTRAREFMELAVSMMGVALTNNTNNNNN